MSATSCARWFARAPTSSSARPRAAPARAPVTAPRTPRSIAEEMQRARRRGARPRPQGDVPRPRRPRPASGPGGGRGLDRARLLSRRGARAHRDDGRARHLPRAHPAPCTSTTASRRPPTCASARAPFTSITSRASGAPSPPGVRVVAGTDAGGHGHPPERRRRSRTSSPPASRPCRRSRPPPAVAAECLGLEREIGTLEKGKRADLVVVDGDPLADVADPPGSRAHPARAEGRTRRGAPVVRRARAT